MNLLQIFGVDLDLYFGPPSTFGVCVEQGQF